MLEYFKTKKHSSDPVVIAQKFGLHPEQVTLSLDRLQRLGLVSIHKKRIISLGKNLKWSQTDFTSTARRSMQIQLAEKSILALNEVPLSERENCSLTIAIEKEKIPHFKKRIHETMLQLSEEFQPSTGSKETINLNSVYQALFSFFPLSNSKE